MCVFVVCGVYMLRVCTHFTDFCHTRMSIDIFIFERNVMNVSNSNAKQMTIHVHFSLSFGISVCSHPIYFIHHSFFHLVWHYRGSLPVGHITMP